VLLPLFSMSMSWPAGNTPTIDSIIAAAGDQIAEQLDAEHGAEVKDPAIYRAHAAKYEVGALCEKVNRQALGIWQVRG
jgi:hypothetical protein